MHAKLQMSCLIHIETSAKVCSVALSKDGSVLFNKENYNGGSHAELLGVYVYEAIQFAKQNGYKLDAVSVSSGPGSYTGLRIGVSEAKGLCYGLDIPLISLSTLDIMASQVIRSGMEADFYCSMIDARRMEAYVAIYDKHLNKVKDISSDIIDSESYSEFIDRGRICFFGDGAAKCQGIISPAKEVLFIEGVYPLASSMVDLAEEKYQRKEFVDVAYFEPFYLKEFITTIAKNKII